MISIVAVVGLRNLALLSFVNGDILYYIGLSVITFLLPAMLVITDFGTVWQKKGDLYSWVKMALGVEAAFFAVWLKWAKSLFTFPLVLAFFAGTFGYIVAPHEVSNKYYLTAVIWLGFIGMSYLSYHGIKASSWFSLYTGLVGVILPCVLLVLFATIWSAHHFTQLRVLALQEWGASLNLHKLVALCIIFLCFAGIEGVSACLGTSQQRRRFFPKVLWSTAFIGVCVFLLGALACSAVLPSQHLDLITGLMQTFKAYLISWHMLWLTPVLALFLVLGVVGSLSNWSTFSNRGMLYASKDGLLPPPIQRLNRYGAPSILIIFQCIFVLLVSLVFIYMPNTSSAFWMLSLLAVQVYLLSYLLLFVSAIVIYFRHERRKKTVVTKVKIVVAAMGFLSSLAVFFLGFVTPAGVKVTSLLRYESTLLGFIFLFLGVGAIILVRRRASWKLFAQAQALTGHR